MIEQVAAEETVGWDAIRFHPASETGWNRTRRAIRPRIGWIDEAPHADPPHRRHQLRRRDGPRVRARGQRAGTSCTSTACSQNAALLDDFQILAIPGGFSYGDDIAAGRILANQIIHHLGDALREFIEAGKPVIGICNGFQVLVKTDLLPGDSPGAPGRPAR